MFVEYIFQLHLIALFIHDIQSTYKYPRMFVLSTMIYLKSSALLHLVDLEV